jgi:hypothetical protein
VAHKANFSFFFTAIFLFQFSIHGQSVENKVDAFYKDFVLGLKEAKNEKVDSKAIARMKKLQTDLLPRALKLQEEIEKQINNYSEEQLMEWDDKIKEKPYNKEIFNLTFDIGFIERINRNSDFEAAYNDLIDLSDKVVEIEFAEPVDPQSECSFTLNGGKFKNQTFVLPPSGMKSAEAFLDEGVLTVDIEGYSGKNLWGLSFLMDEEKAGEYPWKGEFNVTLTYFDGKQEFVLGGHEGKGKIILEKVEQLGGWVEGKFVGKLLTEDTQQPVEVKGSFKVIRNVEPE